MALFNLMSKLFDIFIDSCESQVRTSDMQFQRPSHNHHVLVYKKVVHKYSLKSSNVYSCVLDASKAFNHIHYFLKFSSDDQFCITLFKFFETVTLSINQEQHGLILIH